MAIHNSVYGQVSTLYSINIGGIYRIRHRHRKRLAGGGGGGAGGPGPQ